MDIVNIKKEQLDKAVKKVVKAGDVLLDIGCGIRPQHFYTPKVHICCEPFNEYMEVLQKKTQTIYDRNFVFLNMKWDEVVNILPEKSVDLIFIVDVIEHLEKDKALLLIERTKKIARKQILIFTPLGFMEQDMAELEKDGWGLNGIYWQQHRSGWKPEDFHGNWKFLVSEGFHEIDGNGKKLDQTFDAFWAIYNVNDESKNTHSTRVNFKVKVHNFIDKIFDLVNIVRNTIGI